MSKHIRIGIGNTIIDAHISSRGPGRNMCLATINCPHPEPEIADLHMPRAACVVFCSFDGQHGYSWLLPEMDDDFELASHIADMMEGLISTIV
jgi:hypothetical protein